MISGYDVFKIYHAVDLHFTTKSYDYMRYHGKSNCNPNMWYKRQDKYHFEVLGSKFKTEQLIGIFVSYFIQDVQIKKPWGSELTLWAKDGYPKWLADLHALPKIFETDVFLIKERCKGKAENILKSKNGSLPPLVEMILNKDINIASAIIFLDIVNSSEEILNKCDDDIVWPQVKNLITKYRPFLRYDKEAYLKILLGVFNKKVDKTKKK